MRVISGAVAGLPEGYYGRVAHYRHRVFVEQLGWRLPDNIVCPMAGGSLITKIRKAFNELIALGLVEEKKVKFFSAQATGCSPISDAVKRKLEQFEPQKPATIAVSARPLSPTSAIHAASSAISVSVMI